MLHEILMSLLGFTGNIIIRDDTTFKVCDEFDLLTIAEKEQTNDIVRAGWYYDTITQYIRKHELKWKESDSETFQTYRAALCLALGDVIVEYERDIADIEDKIIKEGPVPLTYLLQRMRKYLIVFPTLHSIITEIEKRNYRGCQIVEYLSKCITGVPICNDAVARLVLRVQIVFLKQTLHWMLYGTLEDPGLEFYLIEKRKEFDWNTSFQIRFEYLPETYVSPRLASKVMFAGKAVRLLQLSTRKDNTQAIVSDPFESESWREVFTMFGKHPDESSDLSVADDNLTVLTERDIPIPSIKQHTHINANEEAFDEVGFAEDCLRKSIEQCGYSAKEVQIFTSQYLEMLKKQDLFVELFEKLVDDIHSSISSRLWILLRDKYHFYMYMHAMRSTYLLGRGEFFQIVMDEVIQLIRSNASTEDANKVLNWNVLKSVSKSLNIDEDALSSIVQLKVHSHIVNISDFDDAELVRHEHSKLIENKYHDSVVYQLRCGSDASLNLDDLYMRSYNWLSDERSVMKGFSLSVNFMCSWPAVWRLTPSDIDDDLLLGSLFGMLQSSGVDVHEGAGRMGLEIPGSLSVGVGIYARVINGAVRYIAKVLIHSLKRTGTRKFASVDSTANFSGVDDIPVAVALQESEVMFYNSDIEEATIYGASRRALNMMSTLVLEVEYVRELSAAADSDVASVATASGIIYKLKARIREVGVRSASLNKWDVEMPISVDQYVKLRAGKCYIGIVTSSRVVQSSSFFFDISNLHVHSKGSITSHPVTSTFTAARYPQLSNKMEEILTAYRNWIHMRITLQFPSIFTIVFDQEVMKSYETMFSMLMKIRFIGYSLERLFMSSFGKYTPLIKMLWNIRHSMMFFVNNLLYYLQVDVVDAEYEILLSQMRKTKSFKIILQAHRNFISAVMRMSMADNTIVQDAIERVMQVCMRFIAICAVCEECCVESVGVSSCNGIIVPAEEIEAIRKDFFTQSIYLFHIMRKVENRGLLFRIDFNGFMSNMSSMNYAASADSSGSRVLA